MNRHSSRIARWRTTVAAAAVAILVLPPVAAAAIDRGAAAANDPPLRDPVTVDVQGQRVAANVCAYTFELTVAPGQPAVREDVTLVDDATCTLRAERGVPMDEAEPEDPPGTAVKSGHAQAAGRALAATSRALATHSHGYHKSYYEDPVKLDVNSVRNDVDWTWNGSSVSNGSCEYHYGWLSGSGWGLKDNNFFCRYEGSPAQLRSSSYAHFKNGIFCIGIDTHTYYDRNNAYGRRNGDLVGTVTAYKKGGCTSLLSFHHFLKRTLN